MNSPLMAQPSPFQMLLGSQTFDKLSNKEKDFLSALEKDLIKHKNLPHVLNISVDTELCEMPKYNYEKKNLFVIIELKESQEIIEDVSHDGNILLEVLFPTALASFQLQDYYLPPKFSNEKEVFAKTKMASIGEFAMIFGVKFTRKPPL